MLLNYYLYRYETNNQSNIFRLKLWLYVTQDLRSKNPVLSKMTNMKANIILNTINRKNKIERSIQETY